MKRVGGYREAYVIRKLGNLNTGLESSSDNRDCYMRIARYAVVSFSIA